VGRLAAMVVSLAFSSACVLGMVGGYRAAGPPYRTLSLGSPINHVAVIGDSYTTGTDEGGLGTKAWTARAWQALSRQGIQIAPDVACEGRAGYGVRGDHGSVFEDLTARAVRPNDALVVFFGSRNDQGVDAEILGQMAHDTLDLAHRTAPSARLLVIGPPWPTADPPDAVLLVRDVIADQARAMGATFVDPIAEHWFVGKPELIGPDGIHPTDAGHAYMADKIAPLIRAQLPRLT
jgi:lysophospholipase L1-like esterase